MKHNHILIKQSQNTELHSQFTKDYFKRFDISSTFYLFIRNYVELSRPKDCPVPFNRTIPQIVKVGQRSTHCTCRML